MGEHLEAGKESKVEKDANPLHSYTSLHNIRWCPIREWEGKRQRVCVYAHAWVREKRNLSKGVASAWGLVRRKGLPLPRQMETDPSLLLLPPLPRADSCWFHGRMLWVEKGLEYCFPKVGGILFTTNGLHVYLCYIIRRAVSLHSWLHLTDSFWASLC